ncbi:TetR/AcrR family transcriptional regulator [Plantactinospora sp. WMMB782]|uniref:TetR/AcrR family transcriptional regulator n=1 Tax=Plantactinospora sp. WMMB782 TaxID=3404121 RepID=UPI003B94D05F
MEATIDCLVDLGYGHTSYARIAERAGLSSTRLISYHFADKDELMQEVVNHVFDRAREVINPLMAAASGPKQTLATFIAASVAWYRADAPKLLALREIWNNFRSPDGTPRLGPASHEAELETIAGILRAGQEAGEFREFDPRVMAVTLRKALDGASEQLALYRDTDAEVYSLELVSLFDRATRAADGPSPVPVT